MFVRNGQALGSVLHSAVPGASRPDPEPEVVEPAPASETEAALPEPLPPDVDDDSTVERPKDYDNKPDWVDYAVAKGADRDEAEGLTKPELIELYGG